ncbi:MAG: cysteine desulfurase [Bacteroidales bacterium]|nr:cysteine desulfurase [Bacteroidales bacterium]
MVIDINKIRKDFPALHQEVNGKPLVYLDNAATTHKPVQVIDALVKYYSLENSNVHRGFHYLSLAATSSMEDARQYIRKYINANSENEIIFTRGTTDSINLVAYSFAKKYLSEGDEIIVSVAEHHSNIVPWQMVCEERGATLKVIPVDENGDLRMDIFDELLGEKTRLVSIAHITNTTGTINPIEEIIRKAHAHGALVMIDGAQGITHKKVDVQALDCDFYAFSGHKIYAPMGVGVLYGKEKILEELPPYQTGGEMIDQVSFEKTTFNTLPYKFEAGTPNVGGIISLAEALRYIESIDINNISNHEKQLLEYATQKLDDMGGIRIFGTGAQKASVISFAMDGIHHSDVGIILDKLGVAVRTGHHCAQPLMQHFNISGTVRASFAVYNTKEEIDIFISALEKVKQMFT